MANTDWVTPSPRAWVTPEEGWRHDRGCINPSGHLGSPQALQCTDKIACTGRLKELIPFPHKGSSPSELKQGFKTRSYPAGITMQKPLKGLEALVSSHSVRLLLPVHSSLPVLLSWMALPLSPHWRHCLPMMKLRPTAETCFSKSYLAGKGRNRTRIQV